MKRKYQKPYLAVEPYQLDASVAAACSTEDKIVINYGDQSCHHSSGFFGASCEMDIVNGNYQCFHGQYGPEGLSFTYS